MVQKLDLLNETPSQTAGPYVHIGCVPTFAGVEGVYPEDLGGSPVREGAKGEAIRITGQVFDGTGWPLSDIMLETWQPDASGIFPGQPDADPNVIGFGRYAADGKTGEFLIETVKPGRTQLRDGRFQAPHISLWLVARGINIGLNTRIYFEDEENDNDPLLSRIEQRPRVKTLIAARTAPGEYRFDIRLRGEGETVFLDL
ncbi:protocatechuate 3,4-dioxygenase subunit alpha [Ovoidimarina sediminis]|uniref:protocatechuate 3,4-dioxygenase subunit alpha n=1 Tax=Ovoidimarina sediminis TaxID=3079856 RepID=UPI00290B5683|nr:protocatechuate 3,4-dioxygenase subunit alpha [Rhodophyticola sp. MJ-SS7]MDU8944654.1 protocatechuate 3,4-dioxygenase subunit alpha [Rhodophyticola sp. MJ-SS7]